MFRNIRQAWAAIRGTDPSSPDYRKGYADCLAGVLCLDESGIRTIDNNNVLHYDHRFSIPYLEHGPFVARAYPIEVQVEGTVRKVDRGGTHRPNPSPRNTIS